MSSLQLRQIPLLFSSGCGGSLVRLLLLVLLMLVMRGPSNRGRRICGVNSRRRRDERGGLCWWLRRRDQL